MRIALCQIDTTVADFEGNVRKILDFSARAGCRGADLALFPELAITGYPPKDLLLRSDFLDSAGKALSDVARRAKIPILAGTVIPNRARVGKSLYNVAAYIKGGRVESYAKKMLIPTYDVFDESRYFEPASAPTRVTLNRTRLGVTICEDVWNDRDFWPKRLYAADPVAALKKKGFDILVNLSASPFELGKVALRFRMLRAAARKYGRTVLQVNLVGGNDDLLFDGNSLAIDSTGNLICRGAAFTEDLQIVDTGAALPIHFDRWATSREAYESLVMGTRDYARKTGFRSAVLGLSGGIDSSVTAGIAVDALGAENVLGVLLPGPYSSRGSVRDANALAKFLGIRTKTISIVPMVRSILRTLLSASETPTLGAPEALTRPAFEGRQPDVTEENLQARIRGMILMALSNKFGHLVLTTGNKSELSVGYCTLYGDMCGGLAVISDVPKMLVYAIGRHINRNRRIIPEAVFSKPPSAELRPRQTDQDSLPPYPALDSFIEAYVERLTPPDKIRVRGIGAAERRIWSKKIDAAEYKRRQAPPGLKLTSRAFGVGRREPIARKI